VTYTPSSPGSLPDPQIPYELARDQLANQLTAADTIVAKGGTFLAIGSTLAGIAVAMLALKPGLHPAAFAVLGIVVLTYLVMTYYSVGLFSQEDWNQGPVVRIVANDLRAGKSEIECKWLGTATLLADRDLNQKPYKKRLTSLRITAWMLVVETMALLALGLVLALD
jgi:hypothetical protein